MKWPQHQRHLLSANLNFSYLASFQLRSCSTISGGGSNPVGNQNIFHLIFSINFYCPTEIQIILWTPLFSLNCSSVHCLKLKWPQHQRPLLLKVWTNSPLVIGSSPLAVQCLPLYLIIYYAIYLLHNCFEVNLIILWKRNKCLVWRTWKQ